MDWGLQIRAILKKRAEHRNVKASRVAGGYGIGTRMYGRALHIRQRMAAYGTLPDSLWNLLHVNVLS